MKPVPRKMEHAQSSPVCRVCDSDAQCNADMAPGRFAGISHIVVIRFWLPAYARTCVRVSHCGRTFTSFVQFDLYLNCKNERIDPLSAPATTLVCRCFVCWYRYCVSSWPSPCSAGAETMRYVYTDGLVLLRPCWSAETRPSVVKRVLPAPAVDCRASVRSRQWGAATVSVA